MKTLESNTNPHAAGKAAQAYAPTAQNLQKAFAYGWANGCSAPGMSFHERIAATEGAAKGDCEMPELSEADSIHEQARAILSNLEATP